MVLGLKKKKSPNKLFEIIGVPGCGKSILADCCAMRTSSTYVKLPQFDLTQPIDRALLTSLNNIRSLTENPEQWGDLYHSYLRRIEEYILAELEVNNVFVTNYIHTLNLYQKSLSSTNRYTLNFTPTKLYVDLPEIKSYNYTEDVDFFDNYTENIKKFKKSLKTQIGFIPSKFITSSNYKRHPWEYLTDVASQLCAKTKLDQGQHTISNDKFYKKKEDTEIEQLDID
jgi:hypothetical protein